LAIAACIALVILVLNFRAFLMLCCVAFLVALVAGGLVG